MTSQAHPSNTRGRCVHARTSYLAFALVFVFGLMGCGSDPETQTMVRVTLGPSLLAQSLHAQGDLETEVIVLDADGREWSRHRQFVVPSDTPLCVEVVPEGGNASLRFRVVARAYADGVLVASTEREGSFVSGVTRGLSMHLASGCQHTDCTEGTTCGATGCGASDVAPLTLFDPSMCGGASATDASVVDGGPDAFDSGLTQSDAGMDGGTDGGLDAGDDAGGCEVTGCGPLQECTERGCEGPEILWHQGTSDNRPRTTFAGDETLFVVGSHSRRWSWGDKSVNNIGSTDAYVARVDTMTQNADWIRTIGSESGARIVRTRFAQWVESRLCFTFQHSVRNDSFIETEDGVRTPYHVTSASDTDFQLIMFACWNDAEPVWRHHVGGLTSAMGGLSVVVEDPSDLTEGAEGELAHALLDVHTGSVRWQRNVAPTGSGIGSTWATADVGDSVCFASTFDVLPPGWSYEGASYVSNGSDVLLACGDGSGSHRWARHITGLGLQSIDSISIANGSVVVSGFLGTRLSVVGEPGTYDLGDTSGFVASFDEATGELEWLTTGIDNVQATEEGRLIGSHYLAPASQFYELDPATGDVLWTRSITGIEGSVSVGRELIAFSGAVRSDFDLVPLDEEDTGAVFLMRLP